ncbi:hypothetical protein C7974DRAFT_389834 [Boeremia exigua]|uniref:uncharacterized protein n=1 Tax=Boeremia exigua TaxID=749465 RepID=UPI001E8D535E|nr:uncharacterized protein C7974DRAFT_389834 [Boeremia exigua]KAH6637599.1 hypothetical protein C7974DRAFT_389834 [Boeremia exigua]
MPRRNERSAHFSTQPGFTIHLPTRHTAMMTYLQVKKSRTYILLGLQSWSPLIAVDPETDRQRRMSHPDFSSHDNRGEPRHRPLANFTSTPYRHDRQKRPLLIERIRFLRTARPFLLHDVTKLLKFDRKSGCQTVSSIPPWLQKPSTTLHRNEKYIQMFSETRLGEDACYASSQHYGRGHSICYTCSVIILQGESTALVLECKYEFCGVSAYLRTILRASSNANNLIARDKKRPEFRTLC